MVAHVEQLRARTGRCLLHSLLYPVLGLFRASGLPASATLEVAFAAELMAAHSTTAWIALAEDICKNRDAASVEPLVDGAIARARATWQAAHLAGSYLRRDLANTF